MFKIILSVMLFIFIDTRVSSSEPYSDIFMQIVRTNKNINLKYALKLSKSIYRLSNKYSIDPNLYTAILKVESNYILNAMNCVKGLDRETHIETTLCFDFGISQINFINIVKHNLNTKRLLTDLDYSLEQGLKILLSLKNQYGEKELDWWSRYNTSDPKLRLKYAKLVKNAF